MTPDQKLRHEVRHYRRLIKSGYEKELDKILKSEECQLAPDFLGFLDIYEHLSEIIPKDRIIVDLGCANACQAFYFENHKKYIGVDISDCIKLKTKNSEYFKMTIKQFCIENSESIRKEKHFAICSYVPPWHNDNEKIVRENFEHLFVYYPK